jgi:sulfur carrier protein
MVAITVNGEEEHFEQRPSVREVLERLGAPSSAVAVEVNQVIVPKRSHAAHILEDGDKVEVVTFVGGG